MKTNNFLFAGLGALVSGVFLLVASPIALASSTWTDMGNSCATTGGTEVKTAATGNHSVYVGNSGACGTSDSVSLTANAYSTTSGPTTGGITFAEAELHKWGSNGLGVVNRYEDPNVTGPHATDNQYGTDAISLSFDEAVNLTSVGLGWVGGDSDFSLLAWVGPGTPGSIVGNTLNGTVPTVANPGASGTLLTSGWALVANYADVGISPNPSSTSVSAKDSSNKLIYSSYWLISAYNTSFGTVNSSGFGALGTGATDYFKLLSVAGNTKPPQGGSAPEPGSLALMGAALAGMVVVRRRKESIS